MKTSKIRKVLGANIKSYRYAKGYTQEHLAEKSGLSPRYISDIENARGNIAVDTLEILANCLSVEPYFLIKENEHKTLPKRVNMK